jgi:hypothetical protein
MAKIQHYSAAEALTGLIRPEIADFVFERGGNAAVQQVAEIVGGIGGGWDDPSVPAAVNKIRDWLPREQQVFLNKINCLIDHCNGVRGSLIEQGFTPRLLGSTT